MQNNEHFDSVVNAVINKYKDRANTGFAKYNTTLDREDLTEIEWLNHLQEELMDASLYVQKLKQIIEKRKNSL
jgi:hypothetical protein